MTSTPSFVETHAGGGTSFVGPDAVNLYRAICLKAALNLYAKCKLLTTRGVTPTSMLSMASEYTGKKYKRGQHAQAAIDVGVWVDTMKAALPIEHKQGKS